MKSRDQICGAIRNNNPFASHSAGDPRDFRFPDVPEVDRDVFNALIGIIAQKRNHPDMTCAAAVVGEAGSGKTQLIGRLAGSGAKGETPFNFAYIHPFVDPYQGYRYLLKEVVINLHSKSVEGAAHTQMAFICSHIFTRVFTLVAEKQRTKKVLENAEKLKRDPILGWKAVEAISAPVKKRLFDIAQNTLMERHRNLEPVFLKVLLQYLFLSGKSACLRNSGLKATSSMPKWWTN